MRTSLGVEDALRTVLDSTPVLGPETVSARTALGRVLAESVVSSRVLPPDDCSAMDGYAVRRSDLRGACADRPVHLKVGFEIAAGARPGARTLGPGESARIFTGAPVPLGCDAVVRQEDTESRDDGVLVRVEPEAREHIRDAGEDIGAGDRVLAPGTVVGAPELGLMASVGRSVAAVHQKPRVAILSGGDELVEPDRDPSGGRIVSSNSYALAGQCLSAGAEPIYLGIARDRPDDIKQHLQAGLRADCIVSSAGVSVGDKDFVRAVLLELGCEFDFWGVQMKPGFPMAFGRFRGAELPLVFGLPGNPVSAMVTFEQFVRPALRKMMGHRSWYRPTVQAILTQSLEKTAGRLHFVRVTLSRSGGQFHATSTGNQSSGVLSSMSQADGLLVFPADATKLSAGEHATVQVLNDDVLANPHPAF